MFEGSSTIRLAGFAAASRVNGPGLRTVVWVQGCDLACPGCFNPSTHTAGGPQSAVAQVVARILQARTVDHTGLTLSGGEPFQQAEAAAAVVAGVRAAWPEVNVMAYSGHTLGELRGPQAPPGAAALLRGLDLLVDGRFVVKAAAQARPFRASANQRLWVLGRPPAAWPWQGPPAGSAELQVAEDGSVLLSGLPDAGLRRAIRALSEG